MKLRPEMKDHPLVIAARENDQALETMHLPEWAESVGLKADDLMYIAQQRALRCVLLFVRKMPLEHIKKLEQQQKPQLYKFSAYELHMYHMFSACEMDGIAIGWTAKQENKNAKTTT